MKLSPVRRATTVRSKQQFQMVISDSVEGKEAGEQTYPVVREGLSKATF